MVTESIQKGYTGNIWSVTFEVFVNVYKTVFNEGKGDKHYKSDTFFVILIFSYFNVNIHILLFMLFSS